MESNFQRCTLWNLVLGEPRTEAKVYRQAAAVTPWFRKGRTWMGPNQTNTQSCWSKSLQINDPSIVLRPRINFHLSQNLPCLTPSLPASTRPTPTSSQRELRQRLRPDCCRDAPWAAAARPASSASTCTSFVALSVHNYMHSVDISTSLPTLVRKYQYCYVTHIHTNYYTKGHCRTTVREKQLSNVDVTSVKGRTIKVNFVVAEGQSLDCVTIITLAKQLVAPHITLSM